MKKHSLKPCPFCGGEGELRGYVARSGAVFSGVSCKNFGCPPCSGAIIKQTNEQAVKRWNTRHGEKEK